ncbi:MAG: nuclear transport factor 2 family protein [Alphaproteobacteria bacterium]|nr:nuclear transport factor 2 family protein [Alphaproteobacteria bacterium]
MSTATATATAVEPDGVDATIEAYVATWNETDPGRRRSAIARTWVERGCYRDPVMTSDGHAALDAMLAGVQAKFPGFVLKRISKIDHHNDAVRFSWSLGPADGPSVVEGVDFCALAPDGRLASVTGFIDKMPG